MGVDELFGGEEQAQEVAPEPEAPEIVADEAPAVEPEPEAAPEPEPVQQEPEVRHVPINALLDERDKRKALEAKIAQYEQQQGHPQQDAPDPFDDPQGFRENLRTELRVEMSDGLAREKHGDEAVESALAWANEKVRSGDPSVAAAFVKQRNPVEWLVQQHKREALVSEIGDDRDAYLAKWAADNGYVKPSAPAPAAVASAVPTQAAAPVRVPRSLASQGSAPSDIRHAATGPLAGVDALFT